MSPIADIGYGTLAASYLMLLIPLAIILYLRIPILKETGIALVRMTVQLLFVGFYLQIIFKLNNLWLNLVWLAVMVGVADGSIIRSCKLRARAFAGPVFAALLTGTAIPVLAIVGLVLQRPGWLDAAYVIPLTGMVLGNCLRAVIIGLASFYGTIVEREKVYHLRLVQGAHLVEALQPYFRDALQAALMPTVASMATIGLVALPGMMTGVILAGADPMTAVKYQMLIMVAIFSGTAVALFLTIRLTIPRCFSAYGLLDRTVFKNRA